jgi:hypothetical protein
MPSPVSDRGEIGVRCPVCHYETKATIGWVRHHNQLPCPGCGKMIALESKNFRTVRKSSRPRQAGAIGRQDALPRDVPTTRQTHQVTRLKIMAIPEIGTTFHGLIVEIRAGRFWTTIWALSENGFIDHPEEHQIFRSHPAAERWINQSALRLGFTSVTMHPKRTTSLIAQ